MVLDLLYIVLFKIVIVCAIAILISIGKVLRCI